MKIRDRDALVRGDKRREQALSIVEAGIDAVLPENVIRNTVNVEGRQAVRERPDLRPVEVPAHIRRRRGQSSEYNGR